MSKITMCVWVATAVIVAAASAMPMTGTIDEASILANGGDPASQETKDMMVSVSANYLNTIGRHLRAKEVEHANGQGRFRRTATFTVDTVNNACDSCVQAGNFWNGIACVNQATYESAFMIVGCFWGTGHATDCSSQCFTSVTTDAGCTVNSTADDDDDSVGSCDGTSTGMRSVAIKIGMPPTIGASLGLTGPMDTGAFTSYFIYSQFTVDFNSFMANFELRMSVFQFSNGEASGNVQDGPLTAHMTTVYAMFERGQWSNVVAGTHTFTAIAGLVVADAYYFYDSVACSNGVTASGPCSAETILTSSNTHMLTRSNMLFTAIGPRVDTPVITGSDTKLSNYTFCATPTSTATAKLDQICLSFTVLYNPWPISFLSALTDVPTAANGTYTCGSYSEVVTLYDYKIDTTFKGINFDSDANRRLGIRLMATTQTGTLTFTETEEETSTEATFANGPLELVLNLEVKGTSGSEVTCDNGATGTVTASSGGDISVSGATTTCGYSSWFDQATQDFLAGQGFSRITCNYGNFATSTQHDNLLWDPTIKQNEAQADAAFASANPNSSSSSSGLSTTVIIGIAVGGAVLLLIIVVVVWKVKKNWTYDA